MKIEIQKNGRIIIPTSIREALDIHAGEELEITISPELGRIELSRKPAGNASQLAGSLSKYQKGKSIPTRKQTHAALKKGLGREKRGAWHKRPFAIPGGDAKHHRPKVPGCIFIIWTSWTRCAEGFPPRPGAVWNIFYPDQFL